MKKVFLVLFTLINFNCIYAQCGIERWRIKTISDGANIDTINVVNEEISNLVKLNPPKWHENLSRLDEERKYVKVICNISYYKTEEDGDYHLVLEDIKTGDTMIGEIASVECKNTFSFYANCFKKAKYEFKQNIKSAHKLNPGIYEIKGVLFFDKKHGQKGLAPNGIEIHPIFHIRKL